MNRFSSSLSNSHTMMRMDLPTATMARFLPRRLAIRRYRSPRNVLVRPAGQPIRHRQQRAGHRRVRADLLHPPRPRSLTGYPDAAHHLGLPDIQRCDPRDDLLIVQRDLHPAHLHSTHQRRGGRPRELQGNGESNPRARSNIEGPVHAAPSARLMNGLEGPRKHDVSRRPDHHFQPGRAAPQGRPRLIRKWR